MFEVPDKDEPKLVFKPAKPPEYPQGNVSAKEQLRQIAEIKPLPIEEVRKRYLDPLFAKLGGRR